MDNYQIVLRCGELLEKKNKLSEVDLQKYIKDEEETVVAIEELRGVLDSLVKASFLFVAWGDDKLCTYKRHIPSRYREKRKSCQEV